METTDHVGLSVFLQWDIKSKGVTWFDTAAIQSQNHFQLYGTPWSAVHQASLYFTIPWSLLKLMSIESMMPSNHLILCCPLSSCPQHLPASGSFPKSHLFASGGKNIGASPSASVLPMNIQGCCPLELIGLIILLSKGPSRVFSSITIWKHQFFSALNKGLI